MYLCILLEGRPSSSSDLCGPNARAFAGNRSLSFPSSFFFFTNVGSASIPLETVGEDRVIERFRVLKSSSVATKRAEGSMGILEVEYSVREDFCHEILVASRYYDGFIRPSAYFEPREFLLFFSLCCPPLIEKFLRYRRAKISFLFLSTASEEVSR